MRSSHCNGQRLAYLADGLQRRGLNKRVSPLAGSGLQRVDEGIQAGGGGEWGGQVTRLCRVEEDGVG